MKIENKNNQGINIYYYTDNKYITLVKILGHSFSKEKTKNNEDLVCAGVSAIVFGILNSLDETKNLITINSDSKKNNIIISSNIHDEKTNIILQTLITSITTLSEVYPNDIFIKKNEVEDA